MASKDQRHEDIASRIYTEITAPMEEIDCAVDPPVGEGRPPAKVSDECERKIDRAVEAVKEVRKEFEKTNGRRE